MGLLNAKGHEGNGAQTDEGVPVHSGQNAPKKPVAASHVVVKLLCVRWIEPFVVNEIIAHVIGDGVFE